MIQTMSETAVDPGHLLREVITALVIIAFRAAWISLKKDVEWRSNYFLSHGPGVNAGFCAIGSGSVRNGCFRSSARQKPGTVLLESLNRR
jgi:hypothetical protein